MFFSLYLAPELACEGSRRVTCPVVCAYQTPVLTRRNCSSLSQNGQMLVLLMGPKSNDETNGTIKTWPGSLCSAFPFLCCLFRSPRLMAPCLAGSMWQDRVFSSLGVPKAHALGHWFSAGGKGSPGWQDRGRGQGYCQPSSREQDTPRQRGIQPEGSTGPRSETLPQENLGNSAANEIFWRNIKEGPIPSLPHILLFPPRLEKYDVKLSVREGERDGGTFFLSSRNLFRIWIQSTLATKSAGHVL